MTSPAHKRAQRGFSLIELMIVVVIVGILASVAYPSYIEHVAKGHRTELKADMAAAQQWLERYYSEKYRYPNPADNELQAQAFHRSPSSGGTQQYELSISSSSTAYQDYTLLATRQQGSGMANDACGNLSITNTGVKSVVAGTFDDSRYASAAAALAACWQ